LAAVPIVRVLRLIQRGKRNFKPAAIFVFHSIMRDYESVAGSIAYDRRSPNDPGVAGIITGMCFDEINYSVRVCALPLWVQANRSNKIASEKILKIRFISQ